MTAPDHIFRNRPKSSCINRGVHTCDGVKQIGFERLFQGRRAWSGTASCSRGICVASGLRWRRCPLVGKRLKSLEIYSQRVNAPTKRRPPRNGRRGRFHLGATLRALAGKASMADHMRLDRRYLDLVIFTNQPHLDVGTQRPTATSARDRLVVAKLVGIIRQPPIMRLMPGLRATRPRLVASLLAIRGGRLR